MGELCRKKEGKNGKKTKIFRRAVRRRRPNAKKFRDGSP